MNTFARIFAGRWIAGTTLDEEVVACRELNRHKLHTIINELGESYSDNASVDETVAFYFEIIDTIKKEKLSSDISLKATQLGLLIGKDSFKKNYEKIIEYAKKRGVFVWLDMEETQYVTDTINVYAQYIGNYTGICIQSYLKRSKKDLESLSKKYATVRLVKGAYKIGEGTFADRAETTENYFVLMDYVFKHMKRFTIGTHDTSIIEKALKLNKTYKKEVTFAMLRGIRSNYAQELAKKENVSIYVPFGKSWTAYVYRRLKEMSNLKLIIRSLFGG